MIKNVFSAFFLLVGYIAIADNNFSKTESEKIDTVTPTPIENLRSHPIPSDSVTLELYGHDHTDWSVYIQNNIIYALNTYRPAVRDQLPGNVLPISIAKEFYKDHGITIH